MQGEETKMEILLDALLDTVKLLPFLFVVYSVIGYFERHTDNKLYHKLKQATWSGPILGALIGCVPQCGFSVIGANLYSKKMISIGTLMAIFVSTSDEAIPILLAHPQMFGTVFFVLALKVGIAIVFGVGIEGISCLLKSRKVALENGITISDESLFEEVGQCNCGHAHERTHEKEWIKGAVQHTLRTLLYIFIVNLCLNMLIEGAGEGVLESLLLTNNRYQPALAALIGLIPNCAASIILTEMFVEGSLSLGSLIAGLCTGAGVGLVMLFKANKNIMDNLKILGILYLIGTVCGIVIQYLR